MPSSHSNRFAEEAYNDRMVQPPPMGTKSKSTTSKIPNINHLEIKRQHVSMQDAGGAKGGPAGGSNSSMIFRSNAMATAQQSKQEGDYSYSAEHAQKRLQQ